MKTICLYFEIHQNIQLKRYRFFDIGTDHYYYDDYEDERLITDVANRSYMPALEALGEMLKEHPGFFKVAFSLSGVGMEQLEIHAPQVLEKLQELNQTGCVEFLAEPYSHGLASLANEESFAKEVKRQCQKMKEYFGKEPKVLRNSSLIYSDDIGAQAAQMGFKGMLTEGARHVLGWKSPHYVYNCALAPNLKLLLRDVNLSDDISLRFSNVDWEGYPLFADNYVDRIANFPGEEHVVNIFMELSALGVAQPLSSNILDFLKALPECAKQRGLTFSTPSEICDTMPSVGALDVPDTLSWTDEERGVNLTSTANNAVGFGDQAVYTRSGQDGTDGKMVLSGNAWVNQNGNTFEGPELVLRDADKVVETTGRSTITITNTKSPSDEGGEGDSQPSVPAGPVNQATPIAGRPEYAGSPLEIKDNK